MCSFFSKSNSENGIKICYYLTQLQTKLSWLPSCGSQCRSLLLYAYTVLILGFKWLSYWPTPSTGIWIPSVSWCSATSASLSRALPYVFQFAGECSDEVSKVVGKLGVLDGARLEIARLTIDLILHHQHQVHLRQLLVLRILQQVLIAANTAHNID